MERDIGRLQRMAAEIARRMRDAVSEMSHFGEYDFLIINDDFAAAEAALQAVVLAARQRLGVQRLRHAGMLAHLVAP